MSFYVDHDSFNSELSKLTNAINRIGDSDGGMNSMINTALSNADELEGRAINAYMNELSTMFAMIQKYYNLCMEDCGHIQNLSKLSSQLDEDMTSEMKVKLNN